MAAELVAGASKSGGQNWWIHFAQVKEKPHQGISMPDILEMFQQVAVLLTSGTPLTEAIALASKQTESLGLAKILDEVHELVQAGTSFSEALGRYPYYFPTNIVSLVEVGETSGDMAGAISRLRDMLKKAADTKGKVISAMIYPCVLICISVLCIVVMMVKVIPEFKLLFAQKGGGLPAITEFVMGVSDFIQNNILQIIGGAAAVCFVIWQILRTKKGYRIFNIMCVVAPILGSLVVQLAMLRFAQNLSLLLKSGTPLLEAIMVCVRIFEDTPVYHEGLQQVETLVAQGESLARSMDSTGLFTDMVINMVKVGEETGQLATVLDVICEYYQERVEILVERVTGLMEPVIICGMGMVMASIMAAIYIPMFDLSSGGGQ